MVDISDEVEKMLNRLTVILDKPKDYVIREALKYKLKELIGGDINANLSFK